MRDRAHRSASQGIIPSWPRPRVCERLGSPHTLPYIKVLTGHALQIAAEEEKSGRRFRGSVPAAVAHGFVHGQDVLNRHARLHVMNRVEDVPSALPENLQTRAHLMANIFDRTKRQRFLGIDAAPPKSDAISKLLLQLLRRHARRRALHGVENVKTRGNKIGEQGADRSARVYEGLPRRVLVHPVVHGLIEGLIEVPIGLGRDKRTVLLAEVRPREEDRRDSLPHDSVNLLEILDANFTDRKSV